ncbi:DNA-binding response regulator [Clostridium tetani]|uniref:Stage 0 sporulation protein A homolog n=2 Tax=Clostridium tetani TaxID=1513 RepID=A0A4Q0VDC0_CLOTA|nr:DNA-binding response regulator [Clostridium tetani]RXI70717.1 DNA-binding response regulator [Clostridium tetani]
MNNMKKNAIILIVDDDEEIREIINILLSREGFVVWEASNANTALAMLEKPVDLIILDIMMPGRNGFELCTEIRKITTVPILFLSAKTQDIDKEEGFCCGGDDYLIKPFSQSELLLRIKALLRRFFVYQGVNNVSTDNTIKLGDLNVDFETGRVCINGDKVSLTGIEYQILSFLLHNRKKVLSAREIYEHVWQEPFLPLSNNTIMVHIKNLRRKLEKDLQKPQYIRTIWGKGYYID